jgi:hypothetical protein
MILTIGILPLAVLVAVSYVAGTAFHNFVNPKDAP